MKNQEKLIELKIVLDAISQVRGELISLIDSKYPNSPTIVGTDLETQEVYQRLITLYGVLGDQAEVFAAALPRKAA